MPVLRPAAACLTLVCALSLTPASREALASPSPMVDKINDVRRAHGLHGLRYSTALSRSSSRFARWILLTDRFAHSTRFARGSRFSRRGEILALSQGWRLRRDETIGQWLGSASHRAVLLGSSYRYVGAARAHGLFGAGRAVAWTVRFSR